LLYPSLVYGIYFVRIRKHSTNRIVSQSLSGEEIHQIAIDLLTARTYFLLLTSYGQVNKI